MRAIGVLFFLPMAACSPDLSRNSGVLAIRVVGLPIEATAIAARIYSGQSSYRVESPVASFTGELLAESVPFGMAAVTVEADTPSGVLRRDAMPLISGPFTMVAIDFGPGGQPMGTDGGVPEVRHVETNFIPHLVQELRGSSIEAGVLEGKADAREGDVYTTNLSTARSVLGSAPAAIVVTAATIDLLEGNARNVAGFQDLWTGRVSLALEPRQGGGAPVVIGGVDSPMGAGVLSVAITAGRADFAPLMGVLESGEFRVLLFGTSNKGPADDFEAEVTAAMQYSLLER